MINAKYLGLTANQLAEMASKLEAENAKLRELLLDVADLLEEHTKLRELVRDMWLQLLNAYDRKEVDEFADRMRELSMEVVR